MKNQTIYFNSNDAAKLLGVNVSTIKRWTHEGKLECIKTSGGHRKFFVQHLNDFIKKNQELTTRINFLPVEKEDDIEVSFNILKKNYGYLTTYILSQAFACQRQQVQQVFNSMYLSQIPLYEIYDLLITPVLYKIGDMWERREITITEEHLSAQIIRDCILRLQGIIPLPTHKIGNAFCLLLSHELHDIALKMVDHLLELSGFNVCYSGQMTPTLEIEKIFNTFKLQRVYISSTIITDQNTAQAEFDKICYISERFQVDVFIGGRGFDILNYQLPPVKRRLKTFEEVMNI